MREPDRAGFVDVNRTRLRVWEWGDEHAPVIVCVHGAHDHGRMWDGLAPRLADLGYRVVCPDLRGHGDSGRLASGHVWMATALDLGVLARTLDGGRPVRFVGHSFGAGLSMYVAGVWPESVRWVVNLDGLGPSMEGGPDEQDLAADAARSFASAERALLRPARRYANREEMVERRAGVNVRLPREWVEHLVLHGSIEDGEGEGAGWRWKADPVFNVGFPGDWDVDGIDIENELVACPLLVVTGAEHDTWSDMTPEETARRISHFRDARHVEVAGAGHYVHLERPDEVLAAITAFIDEVGR
jgi:pimeloyl-ACP methyl ester carboxylesterase